MAAYYNENDPFAAQWLRNLVSAGHIAHGIVDNRSIEDVQPSDLFGFTQCHFFAGIGGWSLALRQAGWSDSRPVWTGSCPCQPISSAGRRQGHADERHLWPAFQRLISECQPATVFGEQVASKDGREWLSGVRADLKALGYACGAADLCAAGIGAPHIRQRLYWVGHASSGGFQNANIQRGNGDETPTQAQRSSDFGAAGLFGGLENADKLRRGEGDLRSRQGESSPGIGGSNKGADDLGAASLFYGLGHAEGERCQEQWGQHSQSAAGRSGQFRPTMQAGIAEWNGATITVDRPDGQARIAAEPALFPVAARIPGDVGRLRGSGNAIVPQVAAEFIMAAAI